NRASYCLRGSVGNHSGYRCGSAGARRQATADNRDRTPDQADPGRGATARSHGDVLAPVAEGRATRIRHDRNPHIGAGSSTVHDALYRSFCLFPGCSWQLPRVFLAVDRMSRYDLGVTLPWAPVECDDESEGPALFCVLELVFNVLGGEGRPVGRFTRCARRDRMVLHPAGSTHLWRTRGWSRFIAEVLPGTAAHLLPLASPPRISFRSGSHRPCERGDDRSSRPALLR